MRENANIWVHIDMDARTIFTLTCQQCETAVCLEVCPVGAISRDLDTGAVMVGETVCVGCKMCINACPFGCIHFDGAKRIVAKCNLCNGEPKSVQNCMSGALHYCNINVLAAIKRKKINKAQVRATQSQKVEKQL